VGCAQVASKLGVKVAHLESGLRSFDRIMPEEINRTLTGHLADLLFTTEPFGWAHGEACAARASRKRGSASWATP